MRALATALIALVALLSAPALAKGDVVWGEEWVEVQHTGATRFVSARHAEAERAAIAAYGPFRVLDGQTAALVGSTGRNAPAQFAALLRDHPGIAVLDFIEAPGTEDDVANLALGRLIRARGLAVRVGEGGSVRSGAVELFVAGAAREIAPGAEFAVHGWLDDHGRGAEDYPADAPEHRRYLDYYAEMGMTPDQARAFYALTNSVPFESALWLTGVEMARWLGHDDQSDAVAAPEALPRLGYAELALLDLSGPLP